MARKRLTQIFPALLPLRQKQKKMFFRLGMKLDKNKYSKTIADDRLPKKIFSHKSLLLRKLGDTDMQLQINKVDNLKIAASKFSGILVKPGEVFSFWGIVEDVSYKLGYKDGIFLSDGEVKVRLWWWTLSISQLDFLDVFTYTI